MKTYLPSALILSLLCSCSPEPTQPQNAAPQAASTTWGKGWTQLGGQGDVHFVAIDFAKEADEDVYRDAVVTLCGAGPICQVHFWSSVPQMAKSLPMTDSQVASQTATWAANENTGYRRWLWNCNIMKNPSDGDCL